MENLSSRGSFDLLRKADLSTKIEETSGRRLVEKELHNWK